MVRIIFIYISLFVSFNSQAGMKCLDGLRKVLAKDSLSEFKIVRGHDRYWRYRKYLSGEKFVATKNKLIHDIDFWARVGERDIRLRELRKKQARSLVNETIKLDRPEISFVILRPMFTKIQISFFKMQRNNFLYEKLLFVRNMIAEGNTQGARKLIEDLKANYQLKQKVSPRLSSVDKAITRIENENIDLTVEFAQKYAEYTETVETLHSLASGGGKLQSKANEVLELLSPEQLIPEQFEHFSKYEPITHVRKDTLREIVVNNRISEVIYLRKELRKEKWSSIVSRLSATQIYELTDAIIKKFPWLNTPSVRSQIRYTVDNKEILTHYPNIDRMVADGNSPKVMWEYLLSLDARDRTTDSLIRTFSRRIDTRVEWRSVKAYGEMRAKKLRERGHNYDLEVRLYEKMIEMEKSVMGLPPLAPWHRSGNTKYVRFIIDGILMGAFVYGSYYFIGDLIPSDSENKDDSGNSSNPLENSGPATSNSNNSNSSNAGSSPAGNLNPGFNLANPFPTGPTNTEDVTGVVDKAATEICGQIASCPISPK